MDDGSQDPAFIGFTAAGVDGLLLALDEAGEDAGKILVGAGDDLEGDYDLLQAGLEARLEQVVGEVAALRLSKQKVMSLEWSEVDPISRTE